jgi:hypothetical protein
MFSLSIVSAQDEHCYYLNAIVHLHNDEQITEKVKNVFGSRIEEQKNPIAYYVADSLTFVDIGINLINETEDKALGLDSRAFNSRHAYKRLYYYESILLEPHITNPSRENKPLYVYISKMIGNIIALEITEDEVYPTHHYFISGPSLVIVLLVDEKGDIVKNRFIDVVHRN